MFVGRVNQLHDLIGDSHWPSVGEQREFLIREFLRQHVPRSLSISTGFILFDDPDEAAASGQDSALTPSTQLDIIVWDSSEYAPVFEAGEFAVVKPGSVRSVILVKSTLDYTALRDDLGALLQLGVQYDRHRAVVDYEDIGAPTLMLFGWTPKISDGTPRPRAGDVSRNVSQIVRNFLREAQEPESYYLAPTAVLLWQRWTCALEHEAGDPVARYATISKPPGVGAEYPDLTMAFLLHLVTMSAQDGADQRAWFDLNLPESLPEPPIEHSEDFDAEPLDRSTWEEVLEQELDLELE